MCLNPAFGTMSCEPLQREGEPEHSVTDTSPRPSRLWDRVACGTSRCTVCRLASDTGHAARLSPHGASGRLASERHPPPAPGSHRPASKQCFRNPALSKRSLACRRKVTLPAGSRFGCKRVPCHQQTGSRPLHETTSLKETGRPLRPG